jgi:SOS-response transcriptional repressor LexA
MTLGTRLKQARLKKKLTQEELAEAVGIKQQAVQRIEAGKVRSTSYVVQLARVLTVTPEWLALGEENAETTPESFSISESQESYVVSANNYASVLEWDEPEAIEQLPLVVDETKITLPVFNKNAGKKCFALQVRDNSMASHVAEETSFQKNDFLIIDSTRTPKTNDFVIAKLPDSSQLAFRQMTADTTGNFLKPLNTHYSTVRLTPAIKIYGVIIARYTEFA